MQLTKEEKIIYLANIISIVRADQKISPKEEFALSEIQKKIKAKKSELKKAMQMAESPDFSLVPLDSFVNNVMNFHDMLYVAAVDKEIAAAEKEALLTFAQSIGLTDNQVDKMINDIKALTASMLTTCPNCGASISDSMKFCPECGCSLVEAEQEKTVQVSYEIPSSGIAIEFAESTSANFPKALNIAKNAEIFKECRKEKKRWFLAAWPSDQIEKVIELASTISELRNKRVYINGEEEGWNDVFGFIWCYKQRNSAYNPVEYCFGLDEKRFNIWGCRNSGMEWTRWADWFSYGKFQTTGFLKKKIFFIFDKKRIEHELKKNLHGYRFCPYINFNLISAVLEVFPEEVEISEKSDWDFKEEYEDIPGSIKVKQEVTENGVKYKREFFACGVIPKGIYVGMKLLKQALDLCKIKEKNLRKLLEYKE